MSDIFQHQEVAENVAYRFEDQRYSVANEYGDHEYTSHEVKLLVFPILKYTACGFWIGLDYDVFPRQPRQRNPEFYIRTAGYRKRFVNLQANKRYALPTVTEAHESYKARKRRQISIYEARIKGAKRHLEALEHYMHTKVPAGLKLSVGSDLGLQAPK